MDGGCAGVPKKSKNTPQCLLKLEAIAKNAPPKI